MKFSEKVIELNTKDVTGGISSVLLLTVTAPFRLVIEVSTKILFCSKNEILRVLFCADLFSVLLTIFVHLNHRMSKVLYIRTSIVPCVISTLLLTLITAIFYLKRISVYDDFAFLNEVVLFDEAGEGEFEQEEQLYGSMEQEELEGISSDMEAYLSQFNEDEYAADTTEYDESAGYSEESSMESGNFEEPVYDSGMESPFADEEDTNVDALLDELDGLTMI